MPRAAAQLQPRTDAPAARCHGRSCHTTSFSFAEACRRHATAAVGAWCLRDTRVLQGERGRARASPRLLHVAERSLLRQGARKRGVSHSGCRLSAVSSLRAMGAIVGALRLLIERVPSIHVSSHHTEAGVYAAYAMHGSLQDYCVHGLSRITEHHCDTDLCRALCSTSWFGFIV